MSKSYRVQAIILKRTTYRDHDRILTLFTREQGKISVIAKGCRKPTSKRRGHLELFNQINAVIYQGHGLDVLGESTAINFFNPLEIHNASKLSKIMAAYHITEIVQSFLPDNEPHPKIYDWMIESFKHLHIQTDLSELTRAFKLKILQNLGYWPEYSNPPADIDAYLETLLEKPLKTRSWMEII